jgi:hypothetical protein
MDSLTTSVGIDGQRQGSPQECESLKTRVYSLPDNLPYAGSTTGTLVRLLETQFKFLDVCDIVVQEFAVTNRTFERLTIPLRG